jgi:hypothetical protein
MKLNDIKLLREDEERGYSASEIIEVIQEQCKPWLSEVAGGSLRNYLQNPFYRGLRGTEPNFFYKPIREYRRPKDTLLYVHDMLVDYLKGKGAIANRDNSAFISAESDDAYRYGDVFVVFPVGEFNYTWVKKVNDFTGDFNSILRNVTSGLHPVMTFMDSNNPEDREYLNKTFELLKRRVLDNNVQVDRNIREANDEEIMLSASGMYYLIQEELPYVLEELS